MTTTPNTCHTCHAPTLTYQRIRTSREWGKLIYDLVTWSSCDYCADTVPMSSVPCDADGTPMRKVISR